MFPRLAGLEWHSHWQPCPFIPCRGSGALLFCRWIAPLCWWRVAYPLFGLCLHMMTWLLLRALRWGCVRVCRSHSLGIGRGRGRFSWWCGRSDSGGSSFALCNDLFHCAVSDMAESPFLFILVRHTCATDAPCFRNWRYTILICYWIPRLTISLTSQLV
jgi:hypothetical protein